MDRNNAILFALATELVATEIGMIYLGSLIDPKLGGQGYGLVAGALIGLVGWLTHFIAYARRIDREAENQDGENQNGNGASTKDKKT